MYQTIEVEIKQHSLTQLVIYLFYYGYGENGKIRKWCLGYCG